MKLNDILKNLSHRPEFSPACNICFIYQEMKTGFAKQFDINISIRPLFYSFTSKLS